MAHGGERNKRSIWYALYQGVTDVRDSQGRRTGAKAKTYSNPVEVRLNVSPAKGSSEAAAFGTSIDYTKTMVSFDSTLAINEDSILWVDKVPVIKQDGSTDTPHDYVVSEVAKGLLSTVYAIKRVEVR